MHEIKPKWDWKPSRDGIEKFSNLLRTYFDLGGFHVQINSITADTLKAAQEKPDEHRDLVIRVGGYSAYFVELDKKMQNNIIARTEHTSLN
jgi:pyruvate-formate lyase